MEKNMSNFLLIVMVLYATNGQAIDDLQKNNCRPRKSTPSLNLHNVILKPPTEFDIKARKTIPTYLSEPEALPELNYRLSLHKPGQNVPRFIFRELVCF